MGRGRSPIETERVAVSPGDDAIRCRLPAGPAMIPWPLYPQLVHSPATWSRPAEVDDRASCRTARTGPSTTPTRRARRRPRRAQPWPAPPGSTGRAAGRRKPRRAVRPRVAVLVGLMGRCGAGRPRPSAGRQWAPVSSSIVIGAVGGTAGRSGTTTLCLTTVSSGSSTPAMLATTPEKGPAATTTARSGDRAERCTRPR